MKPADRENQIFQVLKAFMEKDPGFVVVGGYGVSAFEHRFSVDGDIVIREKDLDSYEEVLRSHGFEKKTDRELDIYRGRYVAYVKDEDLPITIDLLVNQISSRQTNASWSYKYLKQHSEPRTIQGSEKNIKVYVPEKELLMALKLHSGRLTDARDIVALAKNINDNKVREHMDRGDREKLEETLENINQYISSEEFKDSFKGVFSKEELPRENIKKVKRIISSSLN